MKDANQKLLAAAKLALAMCTTIAFPTEDEWARLVKMLEKAISEVERKEEKL